MSEPIPLPGVQFTVNDRGGEYYNKLQQLAQAIDTAVAAYNEQLESVGTTEEIRDATALIKQQVEATQNEINNALAAAYAAIGSAGDTATYAKQLQTARKIGEKNFDGTADISLDIADIDDLALRLDEIETLALAGL